MKIFILTCVTLSSPWEALSSSKDTSCMINAQWKKCLPKEGWPCLKSPRNLNLSIKDVSSDMGACVI